MSREGDDRERVPDVILERHRLGELPADEAVRLEQRLQRDEALRRRLVMLEQSDQEIRRRCPPEWLAERVRERVRAAPVPPARPALAWPLPAALAAAAVALVMLMPRTFGPPPGPGPVPPATLTSPERIKGLEPSLTLFRRASEGSEVLADGARVRQGDQVRVGYRAAGQAFGVILSVDGRGAVSVHLAAEGGRAAPLRSGGTVLLEHAFELDDAPLWERFYFVTSGRPFAVAPVVEAARRLTLERGPAPLLPLSSGHRQFVITLLKEVRP